MDIESHTKTSVKPICGSFVGIGSIQGNELLVRFLSLGELETLLDGKLSLSQAKKFVQDKKDELEASDTEGDRIWRNNFFGESSEYVSKKIDVKRESILHSVYVSCWHRYSLESQLEELEQKYLTNHSGFAILTSVQNIFESFYPPDGTAHWLDLRGVIYVDDENRRTEDYLEGLSLSCVYPQLILKKKKYSYEQEARFVMHDASANNIDCKPSLNNPERKYVDINVESFISRIYYFDKEMEKEIQKFKSKGVLNRTLHTTPRGFSEEIKNIYINKTSYP